MQNQSNPYGHAGYGEHESLEKHATAIIEAHGMKHSKHLQSGTLHQPDELGE